MSATDTKSPATNSVPSSANEPATGEEAITTPANKFAGSSLESVNPTSAAANVFEPSSGMVTVLSAPAGASFTDVTFTRSVFADGSVSTPPSAVPPSSRTWNVQDAYGAPLAFASGVNTSLCAPMSATDTKSPTTNGVPSAASEPAAGSDATTTPVNKFAGESSRSENPKSAAANVF